MTKLEMGKLVDDIHAAMDALEKTPSDREWSSDDLDALDNLASAAWCLQRVTAALFRRIAGK